MGVWSIYGSNGQVKATVKKLEYNGEFMGERSLTCTLYSPSPISLEIGDYINYRSEVFSIDYDPSVLKQSSNNTYGQGYVYDSVKFNSRQMELVFCKFLDYVIADNQIHYSSQPNFSFYCETITALTDRIQANLNRLYTGGNAWTITVNTQNVSVSRINIDVQGMTCWDALGLVAEKFKSTFVVRGRTITIAPSTNVLTGLFQYGKGNGLRSIARTADSSQAIVTRLRAMGNTTNMPYNYYRNKDMYVYAPITEVLGPYETGADIHTTYEFNDCFTVRIESTSGVQYRTKVSLDKTNWAPAIFTANPATVGYCVASVMQLSGYDPVQYAAFMSELNTGTYTKLYFESGISKDKWPSTYKEYTGSLGVTTGENRLMLPDYPDVTTDPYIDSANISKYGIREESVIFDGSNGLDDIYPTIQGMTADEARAAGATISLDSGDNGHLDEIVSATQIDDDGIPPVDGEVKDMAETFNITLKDIGFNINDYLTTETATISMRDGKCEGREFEITEVTKSGNKYVLKCKRTYDDSLNRYFPYDDYNLTAADKFVLLHIEMPGLYVDAASQRLEDAAEAYLAEIDHSIYVIDPKIDNIQAKRHDDAVEAAGSGTKVYDTIYEGMLMTIEDEDLDIDDAIFIDHLTIKEGESLIPQYEVVLRNEKVKTTVQQIQQQITDIKISGVPSAGGGDVDASTVNQLIKNYGDSRYLSKLNNDTAKGKITFTKGLQIGQNFVSGIAGGVGGNIDQNANAELESLVLRRFLQVPELRYNRVMVELGDKWNAPGAGIIEEVTYTEGATTGTCKLKLEEGEYGAIAVGDICMGIFHSEGTPEMNATADSDDGKGNFKFAGFYTCYFRITSITNEQGQNNNQYFTYALRPSDGTGGAWTTAFHPSEAMHFVVYGSFTNTDRQTSVYTTRTYTRMLKNQNTWEFAVGNIAMQYGDLSNLSVFNLNMSGYSIYLNNVYFTGTIRQVDVQGNTIYTANDRGAYVPGTTYAYYDRVSTAEGLWLCVNENGTNTAPSTSNSDWLLQVPAGETLTPYGSWRSTDTPYQANSIVTFANALCVAVNQTSDAPYTSYLLNDGSYAKLSDNSYILKYDASLDNDWELLFDMSGIADGEDGASLEVQYSADGTSWHSTFSENDIYMRQRVGEGTWSGAIRVVGEEGAAGVNGAYTNYEFGKSNSINTQPTQWYDAPPAVGVGEYLWMRVQRVSSDGTASAWTVTRIKGDVGDKGESTLVLDFDNEYIQVACVHGTSYKADGAQTKNTSFDLFYGTNACLVTEVKVKNGSNQWVDSYTENNITASCLLATKTITFAIADQAIVSERTFTFKVTGTLDGNTYSKEATVKLRGVAAAADGQPAVLYELEPSVNVIAKYKDDTTSVNSVTCKIIKYVGDTRSEETISGAIKYSLDDISNQINYTSAIPVSSFSKHIIWYLYIGGQLVDKERVPIVTDGKDGAGFALAGQWVSTHGTYSAMSVVSMGGGSYVVKEGHDTANPPLWCYLLNDGSYAKLNDNGYILTGVANDNDYELLTAAPNPPADSISEEFIYKNSTTKPSKPNSVNDDDYVPTGWTDDPVGVSASFPTEWVCKRRRKGGLWGEYSDPAIWAQFGKDGGFKSRVFLRSNTQPATPTGGSYNNPIPVGWSDGVPQGTAILWSSVCTFNSNGTSSGWSTPAAETDTDTLDIEFHEGEAQPAAPTGSTPFANHESEGWYDPSSPNFSGKDFIWRAERKVSNGVYDGAWTITRIKGEKGDSNVIADLDNEVQSIACTYDGKATQAYTLTTNVKMWYGTTELALSSLTASSASGITITTNASQKKVTFSIANNAVIAEVNNITLTLQAVHQSVTYTRTLVFTLNGIRGGADGTPATIYDLVPSVSSVKRNKQGTPSVASISCTRKKTVGSTITNNTTDGTFTYSINGGSEQSYTNNQAITIADTTERVQFYLRVNSILVDTESIPIIADGADGESVVVADFDNEVQSVACDYTGKATQAYTLTTNVKMWYGTTELSLTNITNTTASNITVNPNVSQKKVTFSIASGASIAEVNNITLTLTAAHNGTNYSRQLVFTINGIRGGADGSPATLYELVPSVSSVKRDKNGSPSVASVSCTRKKIVGTTITDNSTDGLLTYSINGGSETSCNNNQAITVASTTERIQFYLRINNILIDTETIPVIVDGKDGEDGQGFNHVGAWATGTTLQTNDIVTMGGGTYVSNKDNNTNPPLWVYKNNAGDRLLLNDGGYILTGMVNLTDYWVMSPRVEDGSDGTDFEFIFRLTENEDTKPSKPATSQVDDYVPSGWTDDYTGVSEEYRAEWFSMRKKQGGLWGEFSEPGLFSRWAEDGEDAVIADLDNEMDAVTITDSGLAQGNWQLETTVMLLNGYSSMPISSITFTKPTGVTCSANTTTGKCTISIPNGTNIGEKSEVTITLNGTLDGQAITRNLVFTIKGVLGGVVYKLVPQYGTIHRTGTSAITPVTFNVIVKKYVNGVPSDAATNEVAVYGNINDDSTNRAFTKSGDYWQLSLSSFASTITKLLVKVVKAGTTTDILDQETINVVADGAQGAAGVGISDRVRYFRLSTSSTTFTPKSGSSWGTAKPNRHVGEYVWACDVTSYTDGSNDATKAGYQTISAYCNDYCFCLTGEIGDTGPFIYQTKWEDDSNGTNYYTGYGDDDPYTSCTYYDGTWYICKENFTKSSSTFPTSKWEAFDQQLKYIASELILSRQGSIDLLQSMSIKVVENNLTSLKLDTGGLEQYIYDADNNMVNFMRFGGGTIGYYTSNGDAIWEIQPDGTVKTLTIQATNKYSVLSLYKETSATDMASARSAAQTTNNLSGTNYYQLIEKLSTVTAYNVGYTGSKSTPPTQGEDPSTLTMIPDGFYCSSGRPKQVVSVDGATTYMRFVYQFVGGYVQSKAKVMWGTLPV